MKYVSVQEMQAIERQADANGTSYAEMMQHAGRNLADIIIENYGYLAEDGALGLVGAGNNGGDALVALAALIEEGWTTAAIVLRPRPEDDPVGDHYRRLGGKMYDFSQALDKTVLHELLDRHALLIDGILGTGVKLPLRPDLAERMATIKALLQNTQFPLTIVAVDCPSGIDCDTGQAAPETLEAERTVTMAAVKKGLLAFPAHKYCGQIDVVGIGLPDDGAHLAAWQAARAFIPDEDWVKQQLPERPQDAHKGTFGTVLVLGGSQSYTGAPWLSGQAAYRIGAGLVTLAVPRSLHPALAGVFPEATWELLPEEHGFISHTAAAQARAALQRATSAVIGPGFGLHDSTSRFLDELLPAGAPQEPAERPEKMPPLTVDADGLKLLARLPDWPARLPPGSVLTPHPGEMALITGLTKDQIQADRLELAQRFSREWGHVVVLKGAFTVIAEPGGQAAIIPVASAALARAGTGDVLAGLIAGLCAQGMDAFAAAACAAWIHAYAGLEAASQRGSTAAVLAGDLLQGVMAVLAEM